MGAHHWPQACVVRIPLPQEEAIPQEECMGVIFFGTAGGGYHKGFRDISCVCVCLLLVRAEAKIRLLEFVGKRKKDFARSTKPSC